MIAWLAVVAWATPLPAVWSVDLAATDGGLVAGGDTAQWAWDDPAAGPVGLGPCWGTNPDGLYLHDAVDWVEIQLPDLSSVAEPTVVLRHWYAVAVGDRGVIELDQGAGFAPIAPVYGYPETEGFVGESGEYVDAVLDLRGVTGAPRLRLTLISDPAFAAAGWYLQHVALYDGDVVSPTVQPVVLPADTQDLVGPYPVHLDVVDDRAVEGVTLWAEIAGDRLGVAMTHESGDRWTAAVPAQPPDTVVTWWVEADDGTNRGRWPAEGEQSFRVFLAAPTALTGPTDPHLVAESVTLTWTPPDSPHPVLEYVVHRELAVTAPQRVDEPSAVVMVADPQRYWVEAVYDAGVGDPSEVLQLDVEVPRLVDVVPDVAYQGQQLYVRLVGASLYLLQGLSSVDLGPDVQILELDVQDVNTAIARVEVGPVAGVGAQTVTVSGTAGTFAFPQRFAIRDGAEAPHIVSVSPPSVAQGDQVELEIEASVPFAAPPAVRTDDDLVLTSDVVVDGTVARFGLAVSGAARIGAHSLALDDGEQLYTVDLPVTETVQVLEPGCRGCAQTQPVTGLWVALVVALSRRTARPGRRGPTATGR